MKLYRKNYSKSSITLDVYSSHRVEFSAEDHHSAVVNRGIDTLQAQFSDKVITAIAGDRADTLSRGGDFGIYLGGPQDYWNKDKQYYYDTFSCGLTKEFNDAVQGALGKEAIAAEIGYLKSCPEFDKFKTTDFFIEFCERFGLYTTKGIKLSWPGFSTLSYAETERIHIANSSFFDVELDTGVYDEGGRNHVATLMRSRYAPMTMYEMGLFAAALQETFPQYTLAKFVLIASQRTFRTKNIIGVSKTEPGYSIQCFLVPGFRSSGYNYKNGLSCAPKPIM